MSGKLVRMERIMDRSTGKTVIIPMDHGMTSGPIKGLENLKSAIDKVVSGGANAILMHKGVVATGHRKSGKDVGLIIHISASTVLGPDPNAKVLVCTVEEAIKLGADAISIHINLGAETETAMLKNLGEVSKTCQEWGMPLLAMIYARGKKVTSQFDVKYVKHAARVGAEMGADIVKVNYTGSTNSFKEVVDGCPIPIVIAGGEKMESDKDLLVMVDSALKAGAAGVSIGRNVFQHKNPIKIVSVISKLVHKKYPLNKALSEIKQ